MNTTTNNTRPNIRSNLEAIYNERKKRNPSYSLRAYARDLGIDVSLLSKVMRGIRKPTQHIEDILSGRPTSSLKSIKYIRSIDAGELIQTWEAQAVLELVRLPSFQLNSTWISQKLGLVVPYTEELIKKLVDQNLLVYRNNRWTDGGRDVIVSGPLTDAGKQARIKAFDCARDALDKFQSTEKTTYYSIFVGRKANVVKSKKELNRVLTKIARELARGGAPDTLFQATYTLHPVAQDG